jgi:Tfp pilus assembly protein PilN
MVRVISRRPARCDEPLDQVRPARRLRVARSFPLAAVLALFSGCAIVPRSQMDECRQVAHTLRSENARMKDRILALQSQNRDLADRAVDDSRRLTVQDEAIEHLEQSVQAYQNERDQMEAAYKKLTSSLGDGGIPEKRLTRSQPGAPQGGEPDNSIPAGGRKKLSKGDDDKARR